jgi:hypothetical protein
MLQSALGSQKSGDTVLQPRTVGVNFFVDMHQPLISARNTRRVKNGLNANPKLDRSKPGEPLWPGVQLTLGVNKPLIQRRVRRSPRPILIYVKLTTFRYATRLSERPE